MGKPIRVLCIGGSDSGGGAGIGPADDRQCGGRVMTVFFAGLVKTAIGANWLILAAIILRFLLRKAPRRVICLLWAVVAVRLVLPFSIENISHKPDYHKENRCTSYRAGHRYCIYL